LALLAAALLVRLWVIPAWTGHIYDGHEAEYWDLFRGVRAPNRGGTVLYPSMQWLWWGLGRALPHDPRVPIALSALIGAAAAALVGGTVGRLSTPAAGLLAGVFAALHPIQAAWSTSAYNVIVPHALGCLSLWATARVVTARRPPLALGALAATSGALAFTARMDVIGLLLPGLLLLGAVWPPGSLRDRLRLVPVGLICLGLAGAAAWPLVMPGEVPGAGERGLSFSINVGLLAPYLPLDGPAGLALVVLGAICAATRWPLVTAAWLVAVAVNHLALSSFNDFGDRHALGALPAASWALGAGTIALSRRTRLAAGLAAAGLLLCLAGLRDTRGRFYGSEAAFTELLEAPPWDTLPRLSRPQALQRSGQACGWVSEDPRMAAAPLASHFNVIKPEEAASLRGPDGCLRWCLDVQDWRWSSRGVRDRALRMERLYTLSPVGVVTDASGYSCLVLDLVSRRCCDTAGQEPRGGASGSAQIP